METLQDRIDKALKGGLRDCETDLEELPNGHVCGHVISPEFREKSYEERRRRIERILQDELNDDELVGVSTLLTYTPEEWSFEPKES